MGKSVSESWALMFKCLLFFFILLMGCGGGSGGDNSGGDSDAIGLSDSALTFNYSVGEPSPDIQTVTVRFGGAAYLEIGYPPGSSQAAWLNIRRADYTDSTSPLDIEFSIRTGSVTAGTHRTVVRFVSYDLGGSVIGYRDLNVVCVVVNELGLDISEMYFSHTYSASESLVAQTVSVRGDNLAWVAEADQSWVELDADSGTAPSSLSIGINPDGLDTGNHTAIVTVGDPAGEKSETIEVHLTVEPHQLFVGDNGVAFSSFPTAPSVLSHSVTVTDNAQSATPWSAVSDQAWLSVTTGGVTEGQLVLTADPVGLSTGTVHYAVVAVSSDDSSIVNTERIKIGFYVSETDPTASELSYNGHSIVADPIRPYVYVSAGDSISMINIYSGEIVDSMLAGTTLTTMTVSSDGGMLFAYDAGADAIVPIDLETLEVGAEWPDNDLGGGNYIPRLEYARFNGRGVVITNKGRILDAAIGELAATIDRLERLDSVMAASLYNSSFYIIETGLSGYSFDLRRFVGHYSVVNDVFSIQKTHDIATPDCGTDIAVSEDGGKIYLSPGVRSFLFDGDHLVEGVEFTHTGALTVEVGPNDKMYAGVHSDDAGDIDVFSYNADGTESDAYIFNGALFRGRIAISGDGLRMISLSEGDYAYTSESMSFTETTH